MYKRLLLIMLLITAKTICNAQYFKKNNWNYFEGTLGAKNIRLAFYFEGYGAVKGTFAYPNSTIKIPFSGIINAKDADFTVTENGKPAGTITAKLITGDTDVLEGKYYAGTEKNNPSDFKVTLVDYCPGTAEKMYPVFKAPDDEADKFMQLAVKSILADDKAWVMNHISFPLLWWNNADWSSNSVEKEDLQKIYAKIFSNRFKERLKTAYVVNLSHGQFGVILGNRENGLITVLYNTDPKTGAEKFVITSLDCPDEEQRK